MSDVVCISWGKSYKNLHIDRPKQTIARLKNTKCVFAIASAFLISPNYLKNCQLSIN